MWSYKINRSRAHVMYYAYFKHQISEIVYGFFYYLTTFKDKIFFPDIIVIFFRNVI